MNILVSACLLGVNCKYSGKNNRNENVLRLAEKHTLIPVCPEQLGGLPTPRYPSEICGGRVINNIGEDVTAYYEKGEEKHLILQSFSAVNVQCLKHEAPNAVQRKYMTEHLQRRLSPAKG